MSFQLARRPFPVLRGLATVTHHASLRLTDCNTLYIGLTAKATQIPPCPTFSCPPPEQAWSWEEHHTRAPTQGLHANRSALGPNRVITWSGHSCVLTRSPGTADLPLYMGAPHVLSSFHPQPSNPASLAQDTNKEQFR